MVACRNLISGLGAVVVAAGSTVLSYNFYRTATDSAIAKTAHYCLNMQSAASGQVAEAVKTGFRYLFPLGSLAEKPLTSVCGTAIKLNELSSTFALGTGLFAVGSLLFGLSRCFTVKCKDL